MSLPAIRSNVSVLRGLVIATALCWSVAFVVIALAYRLELYADGAMFSYAVAVQDVWAFHWHNISGRMSVFLFTLLPAETYVGLTGNPDAGVVVYGVLFYLAPLAGLVGTYAADRSHRRIIFVYGCCSTALLCPLVFGFPTEMWIAHALFWPTLAAGHYAKATIAGAAFVLVMMLALAFTHEGALVLAFAIVVTLAPRGLRDGYFLRGVAVLVVVLTTAAIAKIVLPPDDYYAGVLVRAALHFFDLAIFQVSIVMLLLAALAGYGVAVVALAPISSDRSYRYAAAVVIAALSIYWLRFDHTILADNRYYLRTALVIVTPVFGALAAWSAMSGDGRLRLSMQPLDWAFTSLGKLGAPTLAAAFILVTLVHVVETGKFVTAWSHYRTAVAGLATGEQSDPSLGDPRFVSSARIAAGLNRLSWFSTTPYLSALVANFRPNRLVIDPGGNYFWLSCATATANENAGRAVPAETRELMRVYSCLHRSP
jgi:hypothetical protein